MSEKDVREVSFRRGARERREENIKTDSQRRSTRLSLKPSTIASRPFEGELKGTDRKRRVSIREKEIENRENKTHCRGLPLD